MRLLLLRPELAGRDCGFCQKYSHDDDGPVLCRGQPRLRLDFERPACRTANGCPKGTPDRQRSLSERNLLCYRHYLRCKATGRFPDDPLVAYHARLISEVERECWEAK